jgi:hypothetical protein
MYDETVYRAITANICKGTPRGKCASGASTDSVQHEQRKTVAWDGRLRSKHL